MAEIERIMRSRHGLKLDEPNDFNMETQDQFLKLWDQISSATFFALVVISSIALMVGGIGGWRSCGFRSPSARARMATPRAGRPQT